MSVLDLHEVDLWYPDGPTVLHQLSLVVEAGEHWALLGPNGAGKSTVLALAGARRFPSRGTVTVLGQRLGTTDLGALRRSVGSIDARARVPSRLDVVGFVATGLTQTVALVNAVDPETERRILAALDQVGMAALAHRPVAVCSQGEQARARIARALIADPALLLLDEAAAGLDLPGRADLLSALELVSAVRPELASISVAHHLEELPATTTHVALLRDGHLLAAGEVSLLHDDGVLSLCFGRTVRAFDHGGRWFATAAAG